MSILNSCTHRRYVEGIEILDPFYEEGWNDHSEKYIYKEGYVESTVVDVDLHRYKCTQCGEIFYYSTRAEAHYTGSTPDESIKESNARWLKRNRE